MRNMDSKASFVDIQKAYVNYQLSPAIWRLLGRHEESKSALRDISLKLPQGTHAVLFGHEAAGKTTLLHLLTGSVKPSSGSVRVNGRPPTEVKHITAGFVSIQESEPGKETCHQILSAYAKTHNVPNAAAKINTITDHLKLGPVLFSPARTLATSQLIRLNLARAALSDSPLILLDDIADHLGALVIRQILPKLFAGRTVLITTRHADTAEKLNLPLLLLHQGSLAHYGTINEIAHNLSCPRVVDAWVEGLRYDLLRKLRKHSGVIEAQLLPTSRFSGQRLRITIHSSHHLPALYDLISQAPLIKVKELPPSLIDITNRL